MLPSELCEEDSGRNTEDELLGGEPGSCQDTKSESKRHGLTKVEGMEGKAGVKTQISRASTGLQVGD